MTAKMVGLFQPAVVVVIQAYFIISEENLQVKRRRYFIHINSSNNAPKNVDSILVL